MVRRTIGRLLVMVLVATAALLGTAQAAQAFYRSEFCERIALTISYWSDNDEYLGRVTWQWEAGYYVLDFYDARPNDGAALAARVDFGGGDVRQYSSYGMIYGDVVKWRALWNGYASRWYPDNSCYPYD